MLAQFSTRKINFVDSPLPLHRNSTRNARWLTTPSSTDSDKAAAEPGVADSATAETTTTTNPPPLPEVQPGANGYEKSPAKKSRLTAREKLRAARVLSRYAESKPAKTGMGSKVLDALRRESDGGKKRRSGLPQAPDNLLDDSKRGMPKQGLTFDLPGGSDLFFIALSFVLISTVMFTTTYIVWKVGAIHFNEY